MAEKKSSNPFERILNASNRIHLDNPFRTNSELRTKHFPGAGNKLSHAKLISAYLAEIDGPSPDWQLVAHGTWPWVIGHGHDLAALAGDLEQAARSSEVTFPSARRKAFVDQFSEDGTTEIEAFLGVFVNAGDEFQKAVLQKLRDSQADRPEQLVPTPAQPRSAPPPPAEPPKPSVADLDPITRAKMALIGTVFCFALSLIPLAIQFWRQPDEAHWVVTSISGFLALLTLAFVIDYLRKRP